MTKKLKVNNNAIQIIEPNSATISTHLIFGFNLNLV